MLAEGLGPVSHRQHVDEVPVSLEGAVAQHVVRRQAGEPILRHVQQRLVHVVLDVGHQESAIPVVGHVAPVADARDQVLERLPRRLRILVQIDSEQVLRDL